MTTKTNATRMSRIWRMTKLQDTKGGDKPSPTLRDILEGCWHSRSIDEAEQQIRQLIEELIPEKKKLPHTLRANECDEVGYNKCIDDMYERLGDTKEPK